MRQTEEDFKPVCPQSADGGAQPDANTTAKKQAKMARHSPFSTLAGNQYAFQLTKAGFRSCVAGVGLARAKLLKAARINFTTIKRTAERRDPVR
jgi:hypothetical protein